MCPVKARRSTPSRSTSIGTTPALQFNMPKLLWDPLDRAAALGQLGMTDRAEAALQELLTVLPDFASGPRRYLECFIFQDELVDAVMDGLLKAGLKRNQPASTL